jgi:hypothetical protein
MWWPFKRKKKVELNKNKVVLIKDKLVVYPPQRRTIRITSEDDNSLSRLMNVWFPYMLFGYDRLEFCVGFSFKPITSISDHASDLPRQIVYTFDYETNSMPHRICLGEGADSLKEGINLFYAKAFVFNGEFCWLNSWEKAEDIPWYASSDRINFDY